MIKAAATDSVERVIRVVLFDLDGVIRHFDPQHTDEIERRHGLPAGALSQTAFSQPLLSAVTTGRITREEWVHKIGEEVGNAAAATQWSQLVPAVDCDVLRLTDELRGLGMTTAILTNGTDTIAAEVAESGIGRHFDAVFNSAEIGYAKPDPRAFTHVLGALDCAAPQVFFTDDSAAKLAGAHALGIQTHLFTGTDNLRTALSRNAGLDDI